MSLDSNVRLLALAGALAASACFPNPPGLCRTQADCKDGTTCVLAAGASEGLCEKNATITCDRNCGEGFVCKVTEAGDQTCALAEGTTLTVTVTAPAGGSVLAGGNVSLSCEATGPQVFEAAFLLDGPGDGEAVRVAGVRAGAGPFTATWDTAAAAVAEGEWKVGCEVKAGPTDAFVTREAGVVTVQVDKTGPAFTHTAPTGWRKRVGQVVEFEAQVTDAIAGVKADSLRFQSGGVSIEAKSFTGGVAKFDVNVELVADVSEQGLVTYGFRAEDVVGNLTETSNSGFNVDAVGPVVTPTADETWHARSGQVAAAATVTTVGAPVKTGSTRVEKAGSGTTYIATANGTAFTSQVDVAAVSPADAEGEVPLEWVSEDEAGNVTRAGFALRVDGKEPVILVPSTSTYFRAGSQADLLLTITDGGAGVNDGTVMVSYPGGGTGCAKLAATQYRCTVPAAGGSTVPVQFEAFDRAGNRAQAQVTLQVDGSAPTASSAADSAFYGAGASLAIDVTVNDTGSGVDSATPPTLQFDLPGSPAITGSQQGGNVWRFNTNVTTVLNGLTEVTIVDAPATLVARDRTGNEATIANAVRRSFDVQRPSFLNPQVVYPADPIAALTLLRREVDPARLSGARRDRATVTAIVRDFGTNHQGTNVGTGAGVDPATVRLTYTRKDGTAASLAAANVVPTENGDRYEFTLDANDVAMANASTSGTPLAETASVALRVVASDRNGNAGTPAELNATVTRKVWEVTVGAGIAVNQTVALDAGNVYVTVPDLGRANVFALNRATGATTWSSTSPGTPKTPPVVGTGRIYFTSEVSGVAHHLGFEVSGSGTVSAAFDCELDGQSTGAPGFQSAVWRGESTPSDTLFLLGSGAVLFASKRGVSTCDLKTTNLTFEGSHSPLSLGGNTIYSGTDSGRIGKIQVNLGAVSFASNIAVSGGPTSTADVPGTALTSDQTVAMFLSGRIYRADGAFSTTVDAAVSGLSGDGAAQPSLLSNSGYFVPGGSSGVIHYDHPSGTRFSVIPRVASFPLAVASTPAIGKDSVSPDTIYFGSASARLTAASVTSGAQAWQYTAGAGTVGSPKLGCNGVVYAGTSTGKVFALVTDSTGPADTPWPTFQHDNRNTGNTATPIYLNGVCQE